MSFSEKAVSQQVRELIAYWVDDATQRQAGLDAMTKLQAELDALRVVLESRTKQFEAAVADLVQQRDALRAEIARLKERMNKAMQTEVVCELHDGGTVEGCAGCFGSIRERLAQVEKERDNWHALVTDHCEEDTQIRQLVRPILGAAKMDGDSYGVPSLADLVEALIQRLAQVEGAISLDRVGAITMLIRDRSTYGE